MSLDAVTERTRQLLSVGGAEFKPTQLDAHFRMLQECKTFAQHLRAFQKSAKVFEEQSNGALGPANGLTRNSGTAGGASWKAVDDTSHTCSIAAAALLLARRLQAF